MSVWLGLALWARHGSRSRSDKMKPRHPFSIPLRGTFYPVPSSHRVTGASRRSFSTSSTTPSSTDCNERYDDLCRAACSTVLPTIHRLPAIPLVVYLEDWEFHSLPIFLVRRSIRKKLIQRRGNARDGSCHLWDSTLSLLQKIFSIKLQFDSR